MIERGISGGASAPLPLGRLMMTAGVAELVRSEPVVSAMIMRWLGQHARNDCPGLGAGDLAANAAAIRDGDRVLTTWTVRRAAGDVKLYIITEWDRSLTTVLRADEY